MGRHGAGARPDCGDLVDNLHAFDHLAENRIAPALGCRRGVIEEIVIFQIDEK